MTVKDASELADPSSDSIELAERPPLSKVVFLNDDKTPMDFVVSVLMKVYGHEVRQATGIMLKVHNEGRGVAGIYPHEIAEAKAVETVALARTFGFPLNCRLEKERP